MDWLEKAFIWLLSLIGGLLALILGFGRYWVHKNDIRHDSHSDKLSKMNERMTDFEANRVTRDTLIRIENDWRDEIRLLRDDRKSTHEDYKLLLSELRKSSENRLERIETKIDQNEKRNSDSRHDIRDKVQAIALQVAVISGDRQRQEMQK